MGNNPGKSARIKRITASVLFLFLLIFLILLIPTEKKEQPRLAGKKQFVWNRDSLWLSLESAYAAHRTSDPEKLNDTTINLLRSMGRLVEFIGGNALLPSDPKFVELENLIFRTAVFVGASQNHLPEFINLFSRSRAAIKEQSIRWDMNGLTARQTLYKLIYGGRAAIEEIMLQNDSRNIPPLIYGRDEFSAAPGVIFNGVQLHSGDLLVSRGGAPTSALIARGNDYPGNFSHVALLYVDEKDNHPYIIESHIERGVVVSSADEYLNDKKLRIMVLRLRSDLPQMIKDPMLPHKAAMLSFKRASASHIPYDFTMDYQDTARLFCSEVASSAYKKLGINLWMGLSNISSPGVANWLAGFGVKHFTTQEPSDLEYDPQLSVVVEWRNPETLFRDHIDNAIVEASLEKAENGAELRYDWHLLPAARIVKLYSMLLNLLGKTGPVPEGMSPESALRHQKLISAHEKIKSSMLEMIRKFETGLRYKPPYWKLVAFAREAIIENEIY